MKINLTFLFATFLSVTLHSQQQTNWKNYTDMKQVNSVQALGDGVWAATGGGGFFYNTFSNDFKRLTKTDGFFSTALTATCVDSTGKVWFGSSSGEISVFNPSDNSTRTILDIYNSNNVNKQINELYVSGDTVFISTEFGLSLIDSKSFVFYDTYNKFGNLSSNIRVVSTFKHNLIHASTEFGIAVQKAGAINLSAPESWNVYTTGNGLPSNIIRKVRLFRDTIIAATEKGLSMFNGTSWQTFLPSFNNISIIDILVSNDSLLISHGNSISAYYQGVVSSIFTSPFDIRKISISSAGLFATSSKGVIKIESNNNYKSIIPNGPEANQFPNMTVDRESNLWSASGINGTGKGLYKYDGIQWSVYDVAHYPELYQNDYYSVYSASGNTIYAGNWGQGFAKIKNDIVTRFHSGNTPMVGIPNDPNFVVITSFAEDSKKNLWILNLNAADRKSIYMLTPDSVWYSFGNPLEQHAAFSEVKNLVIDQYGTKWYSMSAQGSIGLFYYNEKGTYSETTDDAFGYITNTNGLNDNTVNSIVLDHRGDLWIGTSLGVNIIANSSSVLASNPSVRISSVFVLRQQTINCIAVDPLNQKWIGTNQGLLLVNSDGSRLLATYDTRNSPLLDDVIRSIAIDENKGTVYVGTDAGLTSFETPAVKPLESFAELFVYPNPILVEDKSKLLTIDGLIKDSDIKILSISGKLINEFSSPGGRVAYWDGKDLDGKLVNTGIYLIVAYDKEGNSVATSKVAVLRNK
jgi:ligand-binding sensor domain-containing protein